MDRYPLTDCGKRPFVHLALVTLMPKINKEGGAPNWEKFMICVKCLIMTKALY